MYIFNIPGPPMPQKQTRFRCKEGSSPHAYDPSKNHKLFLQWQLKVRAPPEPLQGALEVTMLFVLPIPKSVSSKVRQQMINRVLLPTKKPDEDNLAYIVTNAMQGIVYVDDCQVCAKHVYKVYGPEPKTVITVRPILTMERVGLDLNEFLHNIS